jgi:hypothetical protein
LNRASPAIAAPAAATAPASAPTAPAAALLTPGLSGRAATAAKWASMRELRVGMPCGLLRVLSTTAEGPPARTVAAAAADSLKTPAFQAASACRCHVKKQEQHNNSNITAVQQQNQHYRTPQQEHT